MKIQQRSPAFAAHRPLSARLSPQGDLLELGANRNIHGEGYKFVSAVCSGCICAGVLSLVGSAVGHPAAGFAIGGIFGAVMGYNAT